MLRIKQSLRHFALLCTTAVVLSFPTHTLFSMEETTTVSEKSNTSPTYLEHKLPTGIAQLDTGRTEIASNFNELHCQLLSTLVDYAHMDFIIPFLHGVEDEEERISTHQKLQKTLIENLKAGNPFAVVILFEHAKYLEKEPQNYLVECLDVADISADDVLRTITFSNALAIAMNGNSPMTQFLWQHTFDATWHQPLNKMQSEPQSAMHEMAINTENQTAQYMYMRSFHQTNLDKEIIIPILTGFKDMGISAVDDYLGVVDYTDIIKTLDTLTPEDAESRWSVFFQTYIQYPLSQYLATIPLQKHGLAQGLWPKGFTPALHTYAEMETGESIKDVLMEVIKKTKSIDFAEYYLLFNLQDFNPNAEDARTDYEALAFEAKRERNLRIVAELTELTKLVPECISVALTLVHSQAMESLGNASLAPALRMEAMTRLKDAGSRMAKTLITQANIGDLGGNSYDDLSIRLGVKRVNNLSAEDQCNPEEVAEILELRFTEAMYNALDGDKGSQEAFLSLQTLTQESGYPTIEDFSVIYDYLIQQQRPVLEIDASLITKANNLRAIFSHYFNMINLLNGRNTLEFHTPVKFKEELMA